MPRHSPRRDAPATPDASPAAASPSGEPARSNDDFPWDSFDSDWYLRHNYRSLRDDDAQIIKLMGEFFAQVNMEPGHGIDVGTGTNLYPALAMLPLCRRITLREHSASNYAWIRREIEHYSASWDEFWAILAGSGPYLRIDDPRAALTERATVEQGSIFDLPRSTWDVGTMFFVAESITCTREEFARAVRCFMGSLKPGAPFAAAFMRNSQGYPVGPDVFPAVAITESDVRECVLDAAGKDIQIRNIASDTPLRDGYSGMMFVTGRVARG